MKLARVKKKAESEQNGFYKQSKGFKDVENSYDKNKKAKNL